MALIIEDRVMETSTSTGTGDITLAGAVTGFRAFSAVCTTNDTVYYVIEAVDADGVPTGDWETGLGTYSAANTLTRTTVHASTNAHAAVSFAAGTKRVALNPTATQIKALMPVVTTDADDYTVLAADNGKYIRLTDATSKTITVQDEADQALPANGEWHFRNVGAGDATFVEDTAVTINPPYGGTLVMPQHATATLKRVTADEFDLIGVTVPA